MVLALAAGCAVGPGTPPGAATGETGSPAMALARVEVQEATDFCVDWSAVTTDVNGAPIAASDFARLVLVDFAMAEDALLAALAADPFSQDGGSPYLLDNSAGRTSACASELAIIGNSFDLDRFVGGADRTWVLWLLADPDPVEIPRGTIVIPTSTSTNHEVVLEDPI